MPLRVGCAMWANRDWVGDFLPTGTVPGRMLATYGRHFAAVEGNTTFYGLPAERTVQRWVADTDAAFRFVFKLPRTITHERRLRDCAAELREFCSRLEPLGPRLGPTSVQLPASFGPEQLGVLGQFLEQVPRERPWAVEVRHREFFAGGSSEAALDDLLQRVGADRVVLDSRALFSRPPVDEVDRVAHGAKPRLPVRPVATASCPVIRFIGHRDAEVSAAHWDRWLPVVARWLRTGLDPIVFFHTADNVDAPAQARRFVRELRQYDPTAVVIGSAPGLAEGGDPPALPLA